MNETKARNVGTAEDEIDAAIEKALAAVQAERSVLCVKESCATVRDANPQVVL